MKNDIKTVDRLSIELFFISLAILLYLARTAIPTLKFPFIPIYIGLLVYTTYTFKFNLFSKIKSFFQTYYLMIVLALILSISFLLSDKLYLTIFKDIINTVILLSLYFLLSSFIIKKSDLNIFIGIFLNLVILFAVIISINTLTSLLTIFSIDNWITSDAISGGSITEYVSVDNNFALLIVFFGMISIVYLLSLTRSKGKIVILNLFLTLYSVNVFFSGSRRGLIILIMIISIMIINQFISLFKKNSVYTKIGYGTLYYFLFMLFLGGILWGYINYTSYTFKNNFLELIGSKNPDKVRRETTFVFLKYAEVLNKGVTYSDMYKKIWTPNINPMDPDSGWGTRKHKTIYPLIGRNYQIVPVGSKGYLMDKTCNSSPRSGNAYSYTGISNEKVTKNKILNASVFCYVSEDFDGTWTLLSCEGATSGKTEDLYNMNFKGTWQKLQIKVDCLDGNAPVYLYFSKFNVSDFSTLKGYVIFAFPKVEIFAKGDSLVIDQKLSTFFTTDESIKVKTCNISSRSHSANSIPIKVETKYDSYFGFIYANADKNKNEVRNTDALKELRSASRKDKIFNYSSFIPSVLFQPKESDPLRKWLAKSFSEDTSYNNYKSNIYVNSISNSFLAARLSRWQFAIQIFIKEFSWRQKNFGGGFNFLNWYGYYFLKDKTLSDYPHNPFLSILLYSGLIGLILYIFLLYKVFYYYFIYRREYYLFFIFFLITFFFSFFSAGSPFDPPIMGFFMLLPFFIHSMHKNDIPLTREILNDAKNSDNRDK